MISSEYISLSIVAFWVKKWQIGIRLLMFILYILSLKISVSGPHHPPPCPCKCLVFPGLWLLMSRVALWPCRAAHVLGAGGGGAGGEQCKQQRCGMKDRESGDRCRERGRGGTVRRWRPVEERHWEGEYSGWEMSKVEGQTKTKRWQGLSKYLFFCCC